MKIIINALQYRRDGSGVGVLLRELFGRYAENTDRVCQIILPANAPPFPTGKTTRLLYAPCAYAQGVRRMLYQSLYLGRFCHGALLLTNDSKTPFFLPKSCKLAPLVTDLAVYRLPGSYPLSRTVWWRLQYRYVRRRAAFYLAISKFTKREMTALLHIPPQRIHVVPCACADRMAPVTDQARLRRFRAKYRLPQQFILFVGNANPRKNLDRMLRAFERLKTETALPHHLVIAGGKGWKFDRKTALRGLRHRQSVHFLGYVPDGDLPLLYSAAELFVFPSLYEGFGIPVVEAQACGTPVVTSDGSALPEVAGDAAVYVDPLNEQSICNGMCAVLEDAALAARLVERGFRNIKRFSWERSARRLQEIIERELSQ